MPPGEEEDLTNELTMIRIGDLYPHPDNPRKDLGDLQELTESIKKNGIMQNLTVVPGHHLTEEEWRELARKYQKHPDEETRNLMNSKYSDLGYTVIIGHRRMAAAKEAGLDEIPCVIREMDKKQQFTTMMEENMQRQDLTVPEQAYGFQLMFDWGYSVKDIAEKTGFSESTINHRLQIAKLDKTLLNKRQQDDGDYMQLSMMDFYRLEKIKDIRKRNEILKMARNSAEVENQVNNYLRERQKEETKEAIIKFLEENSRIEPATEKVANGRFSTRYKEIACIRFENPNWKKDSEAMIEKLDPKKKYWYYQGWSQIEIYTVTPKEDKKETEWDRIQKKGKKLRELESQGWKFLREFVRSAVTGELRELDKYEKQHVINQCWNMIKWEDYSYFKPAAAKILFDKRYGFYELEQEQKERAMSMEMWADVLIMCAGGVDGKDVFDYPLKYSEEKSRTINKLTGILKEMWGFVWPDPELEDLFTGKHELYGNEGD